VSLAKKVSELELTFTVVYFEDTSFEYQANIVRNAKVLIGAHGAGLTNAFLMPSESYLFEVSFRDHWYCDPLCDKHFSGLVDYKEDCRSGLKFHNYYHKLDFKNISHFFHLNHVEIPCERAEGYMSRNPIDVGKMFVDSDRILEEVRKALHFLRG
jgi:hypothetical protein